jgi:hypothetical protein
MLYLIQFTDWDTEATVFHKVGIGTLDTISHPHGGCDRLYRHYRDGARLVSSVETDLLTCLTAERMVLRHVASRAYTPTTNRIRGGSTECFFPGAPIDLEAWIEQARTFRASWPGETKNDEWVADGRPRTTSLEP